MADGTGLRQIMKKRAGKSKKADRQYTVLQRLAINIALILLIVLVFGDAFAGIRMLSGGVLSAAVGAAVILLSVFVFFKVNVVSFLGKIGVKYSQKQNSDRVMTLEQNVAALKTYLAGNESGLFDDKISAVADQAEKFGAKRDRAKKVLSGLFEADEITYARFIGAISGAENAITSSLGILAERFDIFDKSAYSESRRALYDEFAEYLNETASNCDGINLKMDKLLLEMTKFSESNTESLKQNSVIEELQSLIDSIKLYTR